MPPRELQYTFTAGEETNNTNNNNTNNSRPRRPLTLPPGKSTSSLSDNNNNNSDDTATTQQSKKPEVVVVDFLCFFAISLAFVTYVEANAGGGGSGGKETTPLTTADITDTGFELTTPLYELLMENRALNDTLALINSLALLIPLIYSFYVTVWLGDYSLIFRIVASQLLRSICGLLTHIPPHATYLASNYDYPDIVHCLFQDCSATQPEVMPFVSFFSGHVTNMVIAGNDMWLRNIPTLSVVVHALNVFQVVRMLATRGHYTIDILVGWIIAVYFSQGAALLGWYYNQGYSLYELLVPKSVLECLEMWTGILYLRRATAASSSSSSSYGAEATLLTKSRQEMFEELLLGLQQQQQRDDDSDTTDKILHELYEEG